MGAVDDGGAQGYCLLARIGRDVILRDMVTAGERARIEEAAGCA